MMGEMPLRAPVQLLPRLRHSGQLDRHRSLVVLVQEPLVLVDLRLLEDEVHHRLLDGEGVVLLDLLVDSLDLALVLLHLPNAQFVCQDIHTRPQ